MTNKNVRQVLAAVVLGLMLAPLAYSAPPEDKGKDKDTQAAQMPYDRGGKSGKDDANRGEQVSDCNHKANERKLKGQDRKDFVEWCTDHGAQYNYDARRYDQSRTCYRKADEKGLSGDLRRAYLQDCLRRQTK